MEEKEKRLMELIRAVVHLIREEYSEAEWVDIYSSDFCTKLCVCKRSNTNVEYILEKEVSEYAE